MIIPFPAVFFSRPTGGKNALYQHVANDLFIHVKKTLSLYTGCKANIGNSTCETVKTNWLMWDIDIVDIVFTVMYGYSIQPGCCKDSYVRPLSNWA